MTSDSNRFLFDSVTANTFRIVADFLEEYPFDMYKVYQDMYARPLNEVKLEGYMGHNMEVTEHGVGYMKITDKDINEFGVDSGSPGNIVNSFNFIEGVYVWVTMTEDVKNENIRISIRSRGPVINKVAEKYNGGGHKFASGVRIKDFDESMKLINDLDKELEKYLKSKEEE